MSDNDLFVAAQERINKLGAEKRANVGIIEAKTKRNSEIDAELGEYATFMAVGAKLGAPSPKPAIQSMTNHELRKHTEKMIVEYGKKKKLIVETAKEAIDKYGALTARRILQEMQVRGLDHYVGGKDDNAKIANLSGVLSRDPRFYSDKEAGGYRYRETAPQGANQEGLL